MEEARRVPGEGTYSHVEAVTADGPCSRGDPFHPAIHMDVYEEWHEKLDRTKKRLRVALNFMSDICSDGEWLVFDEHGSPCPHTDTAGVQDVVRRFCERHPQHTFLVLTKRPEALISPWPANVHVGVSASTAAKARERLRHLSRVECGLRWLSPEPWDDADANVFGEAK
jgi:hypothetical protein